MKLSIIVTCYNSADTIERAIESIPVRDDIEIIFVDDGSTDGSWDRVQKYNHIKKFKHSINMGVGSARNTGFDNATGDYLWAVDSDDYVFTEELNKFLNTWKYDDYDMVHTLIQVNNGEVWNREGKSTAFHTYFLKRSFLGSLRCKESKDIHNYEDGDIHKQLLKNNPKRICVDSCLYHYNYPRKYSIMWQRWGKE